MKVPHSGVWIQSGEQLDGRVCPSHYQPTQSMKQHHSDFSYPTNKGNFISFKHLLVSICKIWTLVWIALYHLDNLVYVHLNEYFISWVLVEKSSFGIPSFNVYILLSGHISCSRQAQKADCCILWYSDPQIICYISPLEILHSLHTTIRGPMVSHR